MRPPEGPATPSRRYACHVAVEATLRDTDGLGHVNNAVYLSWLERVRTRYVVDRRCFEDVRQVDFVLASARLDFRSPVEMLEWVDLWCAPSRVGRTSWDLVYEARARREGRLVLEARTVQVQFDYDRKTPVPIPEPWRRVLEAELGRAAEETP